MDANTSAFMVFIGNFIDSFVSLLQRHEILGYSWFSVITGCMVLTWLLTRLGLHSGKQSKQKGSRKHFSNERSISDDDVHYANFD